jgi:8-oxo-dGTP pyrophosphatase MutT (NUDIX family)
MSTLRYNRNRYGDAIVGPNNLPHDPVRFTEEMQRLLASWRRRVKGVWLRIPNSHSHLIPCAHQLGFSNHHCGNGYIMFSKWIPERERTKIPSFATHVVRVEAVVTRCASMQSEMEVLLVRELHSTEKSYWKFISGGVETGEFIAEAGKREVREEVGLDVRFVHMIGVLNRINARFGRNEVVFGAYYALMGSYEESERLRIQADELAECAWIPISVAIKMWMDYPPDQVRIELQWIRGIDHGWRYFDAPDYRKGNRNMQYHGV